MKDVAIPNVARDCTAKLPRVGVKGQQIDCTGKWLRLAQVHDEVWMENQPPATPESLWSDLRASGLRADLFTFGQALPNTEPCFPYHLEWDNLAVARTTDYSAWWESLPQESRKNVRRSCKRGLRVEAVEFNDELVRGIKNIYDETPIRQGRRFWHYRKDVETVKRENSSYLDRSQFLAAFHEAELVGFLKMVYVGPAGRIMQILSKNSHADKRPTNALLAKAVEICSLRPVDYLIYGQYVYDNKADSPVTEFKRRNGFQQVLLPRYYIPLSAKGRLALRLGLHRGFKPLLPGRVVLTLLSVREAYYERTLLRSRNLHC
jgi:hypothetical protein